MKMRRWLASSGHVDLVSGRMPRRELGWLGLATLLPLGWFVAHFGHVVVSHGGTALVAGLGIFGAAFLLSWACEVAQLDVPRALALAALALIAVLPEYAVDVYFAWRAGTDPTYTAFATANMTGGNRLLLGVGWAAPVFAVWARFGQREVVLPREQAVEVSFLALATLYSFVIPLKGTLSLIDTAVLFGIFLAYVRAAGGTHHEEPELDGPAKAIADLGTGRRRIVIGVMALVAGAAILTAAEPFAEGLIATGRQFHVEEFLLVQWLAPLASESPEFVVALLFALRGAAAAGIGAMISSKVNQWTLLVGALPLAFALSSGSMHPMVLDDRQREEIFLTAAQSVFGLVVIGNYRVGIGEAAMLFGLFALQLVFTSAAARWIYAGTYLGLSAATMLVWPDTRRAMGELVFGRLRRRRA
jgi:cation:H+ antiporter